MFDISDQDLKYLMKWVVLEKNENVFIRHISFPIVASPGKEQTGRANLMYQLAISLTRIFIPQVRLKKPVARIFGFLTSTLEILDKTKVHP